MENLTELQIKELFSENELEFFESLSPSAKKNFIMHITSAKQEKTQLKRIEEVKGAMELKCKHIFDYKKKINPREEIKEDMSESQKIDVYFNKVEENKNKEIVKDLFNKILKDFKELDMRYAWNQPMIIVNESFVMALSVAKNHFSISFEAPTLELFYDQFKESGYVMLKKGFQIKYDQEINYNLLKEAIKYTIGYKKDSTSFWVE